VEGGPRNCKPGFTRARVAGLTLRTLADGKGNITLTVDTDKIQEDKGKAMEKVHDLGNQGKDKAVAPTEKGQGQAARPVQPPQD
jgi:hypothetical protein